MLEIKKQGAGEKNQASAGMIKLTEDSRSLKSPPKKVSSISSQVASTKISKFSPEVKKRKKRKLKGEKTEVGRDWKYKVVNAFDLDEFWVAERINNKVWKRKYLP